MDKINTYASWDNYAVLYNDDKGTFSIRCLNKSDAVYDAGVTDIIIDGKSIGGLESFNKCVLESDRYNKESVALNVKYTEGKAGIKSIAFKFIVSSEGIKLKVKTPENCIVEITGKMSWGDGGCENTYPMSSSKKSPVLRSANGPASSAMDDMLFDRLADNAIKLKGAEKIRIKYDWENKCYGFKALTGRTASKKSMSFSAIKDIMANQYGIDYAPLSKERTFKKPPAGWMTWYSVRFNACEEIVLKNAKWMSENLKKYGAECVWVDWEWYHKDFSGIRDDGADSFNPDKEKYPHGLKYISDKIKEMGLEPALWIGFTVDSDMNEYLKENPEIVFADIPTWCGRYFLDMTHPKYLNEFLPKALANVPKWGYRVVKYDTLPQAMMKHEQYHNRLYNPELTTKEAYVGMIKKARQELGEECYMLSCASDNDADVLWGIGVFDSARIGGDIFKWEEFLVEGVERTMKFYPLHTNTLIPDSDNVVMREEYNDIYQAASRIYFVSMLGIPMTFGDEFDALDDKRIDFIKSCLPVLDIHPMDAYRKKPDKNILKMNLAVEKEWESYNILNVFNNKSNKNKTEVLLNEDMGLDEGDYLVYDYTHDKFLGVEKTGFTVNLESCESRIFSVRKKVNHPQIISTSRHISQGAAEINDVKWVEKDKELKISAELIDNVPYTITLYVPDGYAPAEDMEFVEDRIYKKIVTPEKSGTANINIKFINE